MGAMSPDAPLTVPGMAEAVEARWQALRLTPGTFAEASGLTRQGLDPVRAGERRSYKRATILGVAKALHWRDDWYDRLLAGEQPVEEVGVHNRSDIQAEVEELRSLVHDLTEALASTSERLDVATRRLDAITEFQPPPSS
jgi:hypothetical protein